MACPYLNLGSLFRSDRTVQPPLDRVQIVLGKDKASRREAGAFGGETLVGRLGCDSLEPQDTRVEPAIYYVREDLISQNQLKAMRLFPDYLEFIQLYGITSRKPSTSIPYVSTLSLL